MGKKKKRKKKGKKMGKNFVFRGHPQDDSWEVDLKVIEHCSESPESITVWVDPIAKVKIDALMEEYPNIEWLAYLIGEGENVEDIFVPGQDVTAASVTNIVCPEFNELNCIGVIHSHHGMGNGFSGTDHEWINQNHNISLCISKAGIAGQVRWKTPCGSLKIVNAVTKLKLNVDFEKEAFIEEAKGKIKRGVTRVSTQYVGGTVYGASGWPTNPAYNRHHNTPHQPCVHERNQTLIDEEDWDAGHPPSVEELNFDRELTLEEELLLLEEGSLVIEE